MLLLLPGKLQKLMVSCLCEPLSVCVCACVYSDIVVRSNLCESCKVVEVARFDCISQLGRRR